jgi:hypothetical protein
MRLLSLLALPVSRIRFGLFVATALLAASCDKVPLLAPSASTITLVISSTVVPVNGTVTVAASVIEPAGTPVQNGTVVTFVASLGRLEPAEARTENGKATVRFIAGSESGTARITAFSGAATVSTTAETDIKIGGAAVTALSVTAAPPTVPNTGGSSQIAATVVDASGNPLQGVPVFFSTTQGSMSPPQANSDSTGRATSTLTTTRDATVTARAGAQEGTVTVTAVVTPQVTITVPATGVEAGVPAIFTFTPPTPGAAANPLRSVVVNWGDGSALENIGGISTPTLISHTYQTRGTYRITVTATDVQGIVGETATSVQVNDRATVPVTVTASKNPISMATDQGLVTFTCAATPPANAGTVTFYDWSFGEGGSQFSTSQTFSYRYHGPGTFVVRCRVRTTTGAEGFGEMTIRVNP